MTEEEVKISVRNIYTALDVLGGKWKIKILGQLLYREKLTFAGVSREVVGISDKMLSVSLKELQRDNLVIKDGNDYMLTMNGLEARNILVALCNWSDRVYYS
ncbi:helix-turn-helix domain-containing protein [Bacteriovorax sp. Seq25_V]|uniref:winged helix-turn-helix transcriptional regulator n=1 Tax=Bacteriovorax sp. Seq25_V TaxID=1201288 RepID=UPI000389DE9A|nr:helix-turn-helix domain-containing protein [Bacteriovorax sp. Seq25_V]EQC43888.1 transcriptional regulator, HxlR family [Bacteriovorax sp. Seq25_V]